MKRKLLLLLGLVAVATVIAVATVNSVWRTAVVAPVLPFEEGTDLRPQGGKVEIRYIANEGILISSGDKRVLIDGLHREYGPYYAFLPDAEREKIESAKPPFDGIDLILVSHLHGDHFHPESVGLYLTNSGKTLFASSQQVVDEVAGKFAGYPAIKERITPITYTLKGRQSMKLAGIEVEFLGVGHGTGRHASIQNLGHIVSIGGKKVLHVGDADLSAEIFESFKLDQQKIDIAVLPDWFLLSESGRAIIREHIRPKHLIATHIDPAQAASVTERIKKEFPDAVAFTTMLEKRDY